MRFARKVFKLKQLGLLYGINNYNYNYPDCGYGHISHSKCSKQGYEGCAANNLFDIIVDSDFYDI